MPESPAILANPDQAPSDLQNITLYRIYVIYRSVLSILLLLSLLSVDSRLMLGILNPSLYSYVALIYLATNLVLLALIRTRYSSNPPFLFVVFFLDILVITLLADTSGGMASGLPILLVITAAAAAVLIKIGIIATLIGAMAVIATLADTIRLINEQVLPINSMLPAGLLGILIFAVSLLMQLVARRVGRAEELARRRAADLYNLQRLNEQIVQHMQMGILLVYANGSVRVMNQAATRLLDPERPAPLEQGRKLDDYHEVLAQQFEDWRKNTRHMPTPFKVTEDSHQIIANFRAMDNANDGDSLVFLEDYSSVAQYAQSLKLASLGRLTASIAHEIRNPLGVVSHAAQLLGESNQLDGNDARLADIIQQHTSRMNNIIESVMNISRRQPPQPQTMEIDSWMQSFLYDYAQIANREHHLDYRPSTELIEMSFDFQHLQRILSNLVDNALRHSEMHTGKPTASIVISADHLGQRCVIDVIDQGTGIALTERAKLFEPFYTTVEKGTGLGLYLCKELCEINNATLVYQPTAQDESCFRVSVGLV